MVASAHVRARRFARVVALLALLGGSALAGLAWRSRAGDVRSEPLPIGFVIEPEPALTLGPPDAPVVRVFGDYACPACRTFDRVAGDALRALARDGRIRLAYYHLPLGNTRSARLAAAAVVCAAAADMERGWTAHIARYRNPGPHTPAPAEAPCTAADEALRQVARERAQAHAAGVRSVPAIFLGQDRLHAGSFEALVQFLTTRATRSTRPH